MTPKSTITTNAPHIHAGRIAIVAGWFLSSRSAHLPPSQHAAGNESTSNALKRKAAARLPCNNSCSARKEPQPGQFSPVKAWNWQTGWNGLSLGLNRNKTHALTATPAATAIAAANRRGVKNQFLISELPQKQSGRMHILPHESPAAGERLSRHEQESLEWKRILL